MINGVECLSKVNKDNANLRDEFQFLVLNIYNEGNLGSRTLTRSSLIPLEKDTSKYIRQFPPYSMLGYTNKL